MRSDKKPRMYGPFHRLNDPPEVVREILESGELWGRPSAHIFQSDIPKVKAYAGPLPAGAVGIEFETEVPPDNGHVPGKPTWSATPERAGVTCDGDYAKIKVHVLRQTVILE
jgi:hypothetical protein